MGTPEPHILIYYPRLKLTYFHTRESLIANVLETVFIEILPGGCHILRNPQFAFTVLIGDGAHPLAQQLLDVTGR